MRVHVRRPAFLLATLLAGALAATSLEAADAKGQASKAPYDPPLLNVPGNRISLLEAVRITLANDPAVKLKEQQTYGAHGLYQTESGRFDTSLTASAQWLFTQQALTLSQKTAETKKRTDMEEVIGEFQTTIANLQYDVNELTKLQADPNNYQMVTNDVKLALVQTNVDMYNRRIAAATDPLEKAALTTQRNAYIASTLGDYQSQLTSAQSTEQKLTQARKDLGDVPDTVQHNNVNFDVRTLFPYRDGVTLGLFATGSWDENRYKGKPKQAEYGGLGVEDVYKFEIGFSIDARLLRGRGSDATGAFEQAARIDWEASELAFKHQASASVLTTVAAYWNLAAAQAILDATRFARDLHAKRLEITDALIAADELPKAERSRALATAASDEASVAGSQRVVNEARTTLALAMGVAVDSDANAPLAADPFPGVAAADAVARLSEKPLLSLGLERRYDFQASQKLIQSGGVLVRQAETDLRPKLDFTGQISANTIGETSINQLDTGWSAPGGTAGLDFELPIGNNKAKGLLEQRNADLAQRAITSVDLGRNIKANIVQTLASLRAAAEQVRRSAEAVAAYEKTIVSEDERYRAGESSLLDSILTQDLQTTALVNYAQAQQQYASLLARLRYETGTLLEESGGVTVVRPENLLTPPAAAPAK
ncbi:MAG TPA: TolC family protein [Thermoanaerobaculia bacterium]|nr:TolC family protein [Thermoanaerobaculia bacterium]